MTAHPVDRTLRIGILGASSIGVDVIVRPALERGVRVVAIAARDRRRAEAFADEHGIDRVCADYAALVGDPEVNLVYNGLVNSLHTPWNLAAIAAEKDVFTEKPFAANADEARTVHGAAEQARVRVLEGMHYLYHPGMQDLLTLIRNGELGSLLSVESRMFIPSPPADNTRWRYDLAGGSLMDLGCYALHAVRTLGPFCGGEPRLVAARGAQRPGDPHLDQRVDAELEYPNGVRAIARTDLAHGSWDTSLRVRGTEGEATLVNFARPQDDDRILITSAHGSRVHHFGRTRTYDHQFAALTTALTTGAPFPTDSADAILTMQLIDNCYTALGLPLRESGR